MRWMFLLRRHLFSACCFVLLIGGLITYTLPSQTHEARAVEPVLPRTIGVLELAYYPPTPCYAAQDKIPIPSGNASSNVADSNPGGAIDGDIWNGKWAFYSPPYANQYWQVDMGTSQQISAVSLYFWYIDRPESYRILASDDPSFINSTTVVTETEGLTGYAKVDPNQAIEKRTYAFSPVTKRYLRLVVDDYHNGSEPDSGQVNLYEVEVYQQSTQKQCLDTAVTGDIGAINSTPEMPDPFSDIRNRVQTLTQEAITILSDGSKFHGYKDAVAPAYLNYQILDRKEFLAAIPAATESPAVFYKRPDYREILSQVNICNYVDNLGVKEVWMWGYHNEFINPPIAPSESNMSMGNSVQSLWNNGNPYDPVAGATYGDISNGERINDLPTCDHTYTLYNYTYRPGVENKLHNHIHQIENLMQFGDDVMFWHGTNSWGGKQYFEDPGNYTCGNAHFTPNAGAGYTKAEAEYHFNLTNSFNTSCPNWKPDGTGIAESVSCSNWQCTEKGYYTWWMQNLPGYNNQIPYQTTTLTNWWDATYDFESFFNRMGNPLVQSATTPTATPTPDTVIYKNSVSTTKTNTSSFSTGTIAAGTNMLYVAVIADRNNVGVNSITGLGLTWTKQIRQCSGRSQQGLEIWTAYGSPGSSGGVTIIMNGSTKSVGTIISRYQGASSVQPISGISGSNTTGQDSGRCNGGTDSPKTTISLTASASKGILLLGTDSRNRTISTTPSGFVQHKTAKAGSDANATRLYVHDRLVSASGAYSGAATLSGSTDWAQAGLMILP